MIKDDFELETCLTPNQLKKIHYYLENYKSILSTYDPPCLDMSLVGMVDTNSRQQGKHFGIKVRYTEGNYQHIENVKEFSFESFWSGVGGFVGIFLGYSLMQLPELVERMYSMFKRISRFCNSRFEKVDMNLSLIHISEPTRPY